MNIEIPELELETVCWNCNGNGRNLSQECTFCNGSGWRPTVDGLKVLELIKRHWKPIVEVRP